MRAADRTSSKEGILPLFIVALAGAFALTSCAKGAAATTTGPLGSANPVVLPVTDNPINNTATAESLRIESIQVENNVDYAGNDTSDHLEIALANAAATELSGFEVFYTFVDPVTNTIESYYFKLPDAFTIPAGGRRIAHFDNTGEPDHFPVNEFALYYTSANAIDVSVDVSAEGAAPQTASVRKDAAGEEGPD